MIQLNPTHNPLEQIFWSIAILSQGPIIWSYVWEIGLIPEMIWEDTL